MTTKGYSKTYPSRQPTTSMVPLLQTLELTRVSTGHSSLRRIKFSPDGQYLMTSGVGDLMSMVCVWSVGSSLVLETKIESDSNLYNVIWSSKGALMFNTWWGITIWDPKVCNPAVLCFYACSCTRYQNTGFGHASS